MTLLGAPHRVPSTTTPGGLPRPPCRCSTPGFGGFISSQIHHGRRYTRHDTTRCFSSLQSSTPETVHGESSTAKALYSKALKLARSEDFEQARELFQMVAERFPNYEKNWISWAQMEKRAHAMNSERKWDSCRQILQRALCESNPKNPRIIQAWGLMELQKQNFWAAVTMLDRSVLYDPFLKPVLLWKPVVRARRQRALERKQRAIGPMM